jgi:hypothetical protein
MRLVRVTSNIPESSITCSVLHLARMDIAMCQNSIPCAQFPHLCSMKWVWLALVMDFGHGITINIVVANHMEHTSFKKIVIRF